MAHAPEKRSEARRRFVIDRESLPAIEKAIGVKASTLSRWKRAAKASGDDWDMMRQAHLLAGDGLEAVVSGVAEQFATLAARMMDRLRDIAKDEDVEPAALVTLMTQLSDATTKMVSSAGKLAPRISQLGVAHDVLERLAEFTAREYPEHGEAIVELLEPFAAELTRAYEG